MRGTVSHEKLKEILTRRLRLKAAVFNLEGRARISGSIISQSFAGKGDSERQKLLWDALDEELGADSTKEVGMLLAYTPDEWELPLEGKIAGGPARHSRSESRKVG